VQVHMIQSKTFTAVEGLGETLQYNHRRAV
jgi:hypothetical protein